MEPHPWPQRPLAQCAPPCPSHRYYLDPRQALRPPSGADGAAGAADEDASAGAPGGVAEAAAPAEPLNPEELLRQAEEAAHFDEVRGLLYWVGTTGGTSMGRPLSAAAAARIGRAPRGRLPTSYAQTGSGAAQRSVGYGSCHCHVSRVLVRTPRMHSAYATMAFVVRVPLAFGRRRACCAVAAHAVHLVQLPTSYPPAATCA
jgi:hypothetical protein